MKKKYKANNLKLKIIFFLINYNIKHQKNLFRT